MLNFDEERYIKIQSGAVGLTKDLASLAARLVETGIENIFFLGTGGAGILMEPAAQFLQMTSGLRTFLQRPAELLLVGSAHLGPSSLVVIPSRSGTTMESLEALESCRALGATVLTLTAFDDSPLARGADHNFTNFVDDDTSSESFYIQSLAIALGILQARGEIGDGLTLLHELTTLPERLLEVKRQTEPRASALAEFIAAAPYHIITGAGSVWPEAHYYGMCILEEMQWIRTRPIHASDFFHGTLELIDPDVSVLIFKGDDLTRPLTERVERFVRQVTDHVAVLDSASYDVGDLSPRLRSFISPIILAAALERVSAHLEVQRDHPLTTRRYYRKIDY